MVLWVAGAREFFLVQTSHGFAYTSKETGILVKVLAFQI
jgi:energy-converting hydrogenase Eha subunit G